MSYYQPDSWIIVKIQKSQSSAFYKVLGGWSGGYLYGSSWRMNSGIVSAEIDGDYYRFFGNSGSEYRCHKDTEGLRMSTAGVFENLVNRSKDLDITVEQIPVQQLPMLRSTGEAEQ